MARGEHVLIVPSAGGASKLVQQLERNNVTVVVKDDNVVVAKWDENAREAIAKGISIQEVHNDKINPAVIRRLSEPVARFAELWNWSIEKRGKKVTNRDVKHIMGKLQLKVKDNKVHDTLTNKSWGEIERKEGEAEEGNWFIYQNWDWEIWPFFGGSWVKKGCRTRTYVQPWYPYLQADYISAEVTGPHHYSHVHRHYLHDVYAYDWDWIWWGESWRTTVISYAVYQNLPKSVANPT